MSDVASKPIFIAEPKNRGKAAKQMGIENLLLIAADGKIYQTPAMAKRLQWLEHVEPSTFQ
jgi:FAD:protein FMN transferase